MKELCQKLVMYFCEVFWRRVDGIRFRGQEVG